MVSVLLDVEKGVFRFYTIIEIVSTWKSSAYSANYPPAGNTTADAEGRTFVYDAENKQVEVIERVTIGEYSYDGDGKRVKKIAGSEETVICQTKSPPATAGGTDSDAGGKLIGEYSTIVQTGSNAKTVYTTNDHLGSPRINTDGTGQVISRHDYHPFREIGMRSPPATAGGTDTDRPHGYGFDTIRKQFTGYERGRAAFSSLIRCYVRIGVS